MTCSISWTSTMLAVQCSLRSRSKQEQKKAVKAVEEHKASEDFQDEVAESSEGTYDFGFYQYRNLNKKLFSEVDLSKMTPKVAIEMGIEGKHELFAKASEELVNVADKETTEITIVKSITIVSPAVANDTNVETIAVCTQTKKRKDKWSMNFSGPQFPYDVIIMQRACEGVVSETE